MRVGIVGAGILGRVLAWTLALRDFRVTLFDSGTVEGSNGTSFVAAGMLSPYCELESAPEVIGILGRESLELYPLLIRSLGEGIYFQQKGTLVVAHPRDGLELTHFLNRTQSETLKSYQKILGREDILKLEPDLGPSFQRGIYFPLEGQVSARDLLLGLGKWLESRADCRWQEKVEEVLPRHVRGKNGRERFDWVIDCRGLEARPPGVRGVRGEIFRVHAPEVSLNRPIRFLHPRYPLYVVPRLEQEYLIGATVIESEDRSSVSVQSALELLSAAYSLHSGFAEARILEMTAHCRPAFLDNLPRINFEDGLVQVNGLYRHGFLLSPSISFHVAEAIEGKTLASHLDPLVKGKYGTHS